MCSVPSNYTDFHRSYLQLMMNRRIISCEAALALFADPNTESDGENILSGKKLEDAIVLINKQIERFSMKISKARDELSCKEYYLLVPTVEFEHMKKYCGFSTKEIEYFKKILADIISSDVGYISSTNCLNLDSSFRKSELEHLVERFCNKKWLFQKKGLIYLSLLTIVELEPLFNSTYKDLVEVCSLCKHYVLTGFRCENCIALIHLFCLHRYTLKAASTSQASSLEYVCPHCNTEQPEIEKLLNELSLGSADVVENGMASLNIRQSNGILDESDESNHSHTRQRKHKGIGKRSSR